MSICVFVGYLIIWQGHPLLKAANTLPTQIEDEAAVSIALDKIN
jgi:hypothetical protein